MIIALMFSVLWPFISKQDPAQTGIAVESKKDYSIQNPPAVAKGLNSISRAAGDLKRIITIRERVDSVLNKKMLSQADSVFLENALLELKLIQQP
ncbi:hypothetical protein [Pedobacter miscanthi]|nr:hypothetical protein [Pedobacter miscanthi]